MQTVLSKQVISQIRFASKKSLKIYHINIKYVPDADNISPIFNSLKLEDLYPFFVECPIYNPIRIRYLCIYNCSSSNTNNFHEVFMNLTKDKIHDLFYYTIAALKLRSFCLNE